MTLLLCPDTVTVSYRLYILIRVRIASSPSDEADVVGPPLLLLLLLLMWLVSLLSEVVVIRWELLPPVGRVADGAAAAPAGRQESGFGRERGRRVVRVTDAAAAAAADDGHLGRQRGESCGKNVD